MVDIRPEPWLLPPKPPSMAVYRRLKASGDSLMRSLMNLEIEAIELRGRVLDVGGGKRASYVPLLRGPGDITSVDIDPKIGPTVVADLGSPLPFPDGTFDTVISFNTLEHLADDQYALDEMVRVTRPDGRIHILVPFLYRVHGHPHDFHRHTAQGWNLMLRRAGIRDEHQQIRPLVWDPFATAWAVADVAPLGRTWWRLRRILRRIVLRRPLTMRPIDNRIVLPAHSVIRDYALAYSITGAKPRSTDEVIG